MKYKNQKRDILKRLLSGHLTAEDAASQFTKTGTGLVVISYPNGLYSIGSDTDLTVAQMQERVKRATVVYRMPDNGRA